MKKPTNQRRRFLKTTAAASAFTLLPASVWASPFAPSDRVNVALIGCRNMGYWDLRNHLSFKDVRCVALCDVDQNVLTDRAGEIERDFGQKPTLYGDYRKMLEQKDIDAVIIGTPDHWHCLQMVESVQAGKDVYVEKPMANTIEECTIMMKAADYYNQVVQVGQQQRNNRIFIEVMEHIRGGAIGRLRKVNIWANFNYGLGTEFFEDGQAPDGVDYDMWLGPAPARPFNQARFHGSWRHFWDYGGGLFSDWGVHLVDMGLWATNNRIAPGKTLAYGANNSAVKRMRETFDTMNATWPRDEFAINFDMTAGVERGPYDNSYGVSFIGDNGTIKANRQSYRIIPEKGNAEGEFRAEAKEVTAEGEGHRTHARNFLDCIKSRATPACPPEAGRAAALHVHAANIAARTGEPYLQWEDEKGRFSNSEKANQYVVPEYRAPWTLPGIGR